METIKYKDFLGSVEVSVKDNCVHGKILFVNDLVTYESDTPNGIKKAFKEAVDDYIETCKELGVKPLKSHSGTFNVRIGPELHQELASKAVQEDKTINAVVKDAVTAYLNDPNGNHEDPSSQFSYFDRNAS